MNLQQIGNEILTQDNRTTEAPIFIVQEKVRIWGLDSAYSDEYRWINPGNEGEEAEPGMSIGLDEQEHMGEDTTPWEKVYFEDRWEFVTACFTEAGCKAFIEADGHNHKELRIYAAGSYRNAEWCTVRDHLLDEFAQANKSPEELA